MSGSRRRATAIVIDRDRVLVIRRVRDGVHYAVLPGGGIEPGESAEDACLRELEEETGLRGRILRALPPRDQDEVRFHVAASGAPVLGEPERSRSTEDNFYQPVWLPLDEIAEIGLVPASAIDAIKALCDGDARPAPNLGTRDAFSSPVSRFRLQE